MAENFSLNPDNYRYQELTNHDNQVLAVRYDVRPALSACFGTAWREVLRGSILADAHRQIVDATDPTCREENPQQEFELLITPGRAVAERFPRFSELYSGLFQKMMQDTVGEGEHLSAFAHPAEGYHFVTQRPTLPGEESSRQRRLDAHVDRRATAVLHLDVPSVYYGGNMVVVNKPELLVMPEGVTGCTEIPVIPGSLLCFPRGRELAHRTQELFAADGQRIIGSLDYLSGEQTAESVRAIDERLGNV